MAVLSRSRLTPLTANAAISPVKGSASTFRVIIRCGYPAINSSFIIQQTDATRTMENRCRSMPWHFRHCRTCYIDIDKDIDIDIDIETDNDIEIEIEKETEEENEDTAAHLRILKRKSDEVVSSPMYQSREMRLPDSACPTLCASLRFV